MRNIVIKPLILTLLLISAIEGYSQEQPITHRFDLEQCIQYALEHNQSILNKALDKKIAETQIRETLSIGLPQINIESKVNYHYEVQKSLTDVSIFDPRLPKGTEKEIAFGQRYDGNLNLTGRQLIFDGSFFVAIRSARFYRELSSKEHIYTKIDVVEAVSKAYYNTLITDEHLILVEANFSRLDSLLRDTEALYINGFAEKIDVSRIKVQVNNLSVERNKLKQFSKISKDLLKFQMGMPLTEFLEIKDSLEKIPFQPVEESITDFNYSRRIEYSQLQTNMYLTRLDMKRNKAQYIPTLYADFKYGYNTATAESSKLFDSNRWLNYGNLSFSLNMPIFDGLLNHSRIQKNKIQIQQIQQSMKMAESSINLEIRQSKANLNSAIENMNAQSENMSLAEEVYHVTKIKYEEGVGSNSEVLDADTALKESQANYYNALFDALIAKIDLQKAYGTLLK